MTCLRWRRRSPAFKNETEGPSLIIVDSHIAFGAPNKQDTHGAHGEPLAKKRFV